MNMNKSGLFWGILLIVGGGVALALIPALARMGAGHGFDVPATLVELFSWTEQQFLDNTAGSAIRRIGHESWLRNIAVALGNAPTTPAIIAALEARCDDGSELVREHTEWALRQHAK